MIVPPVNLKGKFTLKEPLKSILNETVIYKVIAVRNITELLNANISVEKLIYLDQGLTSDDYLEAVNVNTPIVTLSTEGSSLFNIPADYFNHLPHVNGVLYTNKAMVVNLGVLPMELDLSFVEQEVVDLIKAYIGNEVTVKTKDVTAKHMLTFDEDENRESFRLANIANKNTCRQTLNETALTLSQYKDKVKILLQKLNNS